MKVLVTGATGFLGRNTLLLLLNAGFEVHAFSRVSKSSLEKSDPVKEVYWHSIDLMQDHAVKALLADIHATHMLHLAWYTEHEKFWNAPENLDWVGASLGLLTQFANHGGKRVVIAGSCAEYDWGGGTCSEQETACNPSTLYGVSKHALHEVAEAYCSLNSISLAWGRTFLVYGPNETAERFISAVINGLLHEKDVSCSNGHKARDFMHVKDVASAFVSLLTSDMEGTVNIASGQSFTLKQIGERLTNLIGGNGRIHFGTLHNRTDDPEVLSADVSLLKNTLHWSPSFTLDEGLIDTIAWWKNKPYSK